MLVWRWQSRPMFLKFSATVDHYMGGRRRRGPLGYHKIYFSRKEHAIMLFSASRKKFMVKFAINHFYISTNLNSGA
jgi:hypothetical protein